MKFFLIVLTICYYILTQATIHARTTGLRKTYWSLPTNGDYQGDLYHLKSDPRRQAGWGKRHDVLVEDDYNELPPYHPYASHDISAHNWFDDT